MTIHPAVEQAIQSSSHKMSMFKFAVIFVQFTGIMGSAWAQNPGDAVLSGIQVHTIDIRFSQPSFWDSLTVYYSQGKEQYIAASVTINGSVYDSVGVRLKGNASYSHPGNKKSLRLSFDEFRSDQRWDGLTGIHLNNCWGDPTFMREKLHLDFCSDAGIPAPRANFARVLLNDTLWGLYSLVEHVNKRFLRSHYGNSDGDLFKAVDGFGPPDSTRILSDFRWFGPSPEAYSSRYELRTSESQTAWQHLLGLLDTLNNLQNNAEVLQKKVNLPALYSAMAGDILFGNLDSYINSGRNFYFYFPTPASRMEWIVWDVGLSFGVYLGGVSSPENLSLTYVINPAHRPLWGKALATPMLKDQYLWTLCHLSQRYFTPERLFPRIDSIANIIRPHVNADQKKMYSLLQFELNLSNDINAEGGGGTRKPGLKAFITSRKKNVEAQLKALNVTCTASIRPGDVVINEFMAQNDSLPDPAGEFDDWIEFFNNTENSIDLGGLFLSDTSDRPQKWQFPAGTVISPKSYLIVWADEDGDQEGLHANFKLSASGEHLRLSNRDGSLLDSITFGPQIPNRSMARIPNGTGPYFQGPPTFNRYNGSSTSIDDPGAIQTREVQLDQNYPNPAAGQTMLSFSLSTPCHVSLEVFNIFGTLMTDILDTRLPAGTHVVWFDTSLLSKGCYLLRLRANGAVSSRIMMVGR